MRIFRVDADPTTGEWLAETLAEVGEMDRAAFLAQPDTADVHYDTFEREDETCGIEVHWIAE